MDQSRTCPRCGKPLPPDAPQGLCPDCLLKAGFQTGATAASGTAPGEAAFVPPPVSEIARLFPQLDVFDLIGQGGMGAVYKARQRSLGRPVALKVLPPELTARPGFTERFQREARALARLSHPGIVGVYDFGEAGGLPYLMMEYVDGMTLRQLVRQGWLSPRAALQIVPAICDALQYAHDEGVVHRDIKPENILVDKKGRVKIADFGIAKIVEGGPGSNPSLTQANQAVGTPRYMAPEQLEKPGTVDHRADIYALGVVFYEMLTGELPIGHFAPPSEKVQVDVRLDEIVLRALQKEPELRFQQASNLKTEVETAAKAMDTTGLKLRHRPSGARTWKMVAAATASVLLLAALYVLRFVAMPCVVTTSPDSPVDLPRLKWVFVDPRNRILFRGDAFVYQRGGRDYLARVRTPWLYDKQSIAFAPDNNFAERASEPDGIVSPLEVVGKVVLSPSLASHAVRTHVRCRVFLIDHGPAPQMREAFEGGQRPSATPGISANLQSLLAQLSEQHQWVTDEDIAALLKMRPDPSGPLPIDRAGTINSAIPVADFWSANLRSGDQRVAVTNDSFINFFRYAGALHAQIEFNFRVSHGMQVVGFSKKTYAGYIPPGRFHWAFVQWLYTVGDSHARNQLPFVILYDFDPLD